jgi:hypothetical protein
LICTVMCSLPKERRCCEAQKCNLRWSALISGRQKAFGRPPPAVVALKCDTVYVHSFIASSFYSVAERTTYISLSSTTRTPSGVGMELCPCQRASHTSSSDVLASPCCGRLYAPGCPRHTTQRHSRRVCSYPWACSATPSSSWCGGHLKSRSRMVFDGCHQHFTVKTTSVSGGPKILWSLGEHCRNG